jgi:hypothetical protein
MRTTLDIEDDILLAAKELAQRERRTAGKILSDLARRGLAASRHTRNTRSRLRNGVPVLASRGEVITLERVQRLRDEEGV